MELNNYTESLPDVKRASFVKMNIDIKDEPNVSFWLNLLFKIPFPLLLVKLFSGLIADIITRQTGFVVSPKDLKTLINASKGLIVDVEAKDATVHIEIV